MAIAKFKPTSKPNIEPNLPKIAPKEYKSPVRDEKVIPIDRLLAFVSGTDWTVDYYSQYSAKTNDLREVDPEEHPVYQQYTLIKKYALRVTNALDTTYDPVTGISKVTGSSNMYSFIIPNVNDYFVSDAGESRSGLFRITSVERKSFNAESVYEVLYDLVGYIDTGASAAIYTDISNKVIKTFYFDTTRFKYGQYPLVLDEVRKEIIDYSIAYRDLSKLYFSLFFNRRYMTLVLPGQDMSCYDPYLVSYVTKIIESEIVPELNELRQLSIENDPYLKQDQFWSMMLKRDKSMINYMNKKMGVVNSASFNSNSYVYGFKCTNVDYMVYPIDNSALNHTVDTTTRVGLRPTVKVISYKQSELNKTKTITGLLSTSLSYSFTKETKTYTLFYPIANEDYYVLSNHFYALDTDMSLIEVLVKDYLDDNSIDRDMLDFAMGKYRDLSRLEQFYYGPILLTLLKECIRTAHI
jgi:hypothetical protein